MYSSMYSNMYSSRSSSSTMSFTYAAARGAYRVVPRNTEPEVFTFDRLPEPQLSAPRQQQRQQQQQQRRRVARVLYPAKVRKYLPPAEKSPAKRWLLALCLVLLAQIYVECDDEHADITEAAAELQGDAASASASSPLFLHFRSAEETARRLTSCSKAQAPWMNISCSVEDVEEQQEEQEHHHHHHHRQQQRNNPYVVALLYPAVIHTLGSEQ